MEGFVLSTFVFLSYKCILTKETRVVQDLIEPLDGCEGSILMHNDVLYFSNPSNASYKRFNMTVHVSTDDGESWKEFLPVNSGRVGYSTLASLSNGKIGMLYEHATQSGRRVRFLFQLQSHLYHSTQSIERRNFVENFGCKGVNEKRAYAC